MKLHRAFILLILLGTIACSIDTLLTRNEGLLLGTWEIREAFFRNDRGFGRENLSDEFVGDLIEFFDDNTLTYEDINSANTISGDWGLSFARDFDDDSGGEFFLDMAFPSSTVLPDFGDLTSVSISRNQIWMISNTRDGFFRYRLRRQ